MNDTLRHQESDGRQGDALTRTLRDADPAGDAPLLDPIERARMRQAVTDAAGRHQGAWAAGWRGWMQPALAAVAVITAVGIALWSLNNRPADTPTVADAGETATPATQPPAASIPPTTTPPNDSPERVTELAPATESGVATAPPGVSDPLPAAPAETAPQSTLDIVAQPQATTVAAVENPSPTERKSRTVQFTAPRGTRIIWTLDPDFEPPTSGREPGKEQEP